jgi:CRP/FNR family transcriptional regulator, cyclic AMP receptor protein
VAKARKKTPFDAQVFLHTVGDGRSVLNCRKNQKVFSQGDPADAVFYIQESKVKVCVVSEQGRRQSSPSTRTENSLAKTA